MTRHRTLMRLLTAPLALSAAVFVAVLADVAAPPPASAQQYGVGASATAPTVAPQAWAAYREKFLAPDGRIVDTGNGDISHSEGQGYGLLLSVAADDRATFEQIWTFTLTQLLIRDDGLAAWKWVPDADPHIADINTATDGDILIAWALLKAAERWGIDRYRDHAQRMAQTIGKTLIIPEGRMNLILPGSQGFTKADRPDGPVVNPSYWVFQALEAMKALDPQTDWSAVRASGLILLKEAQFGTFRLPSDWVSMQANQPPRPAEGFEPEFGYNSIRIPLYLIQAGITDTTLLEPYDKAWNQSGAGRPAVVNVTTDQIMQQLDDPGYRIQAALVACALRQTPIPSALKTFQPTSYYPSSLQLLALSVASESYPRCLGT